MHKDSWGGKSRYQSLKSLKRHRFIVIYMRYLVKINSEKTSRSKSMQGFFLIEFPKQLLGSMMYKMFQ